MAAARGSADVRAWVAPASGTSQESGLAGTADFDAKESIEVTVRLTGAKATVATDFATLVTNVNALTSGSTIDWNKR